MTDIIEKAARAAYAAYDERYKSIYGTDLTDWTDLKDHQRDAARLQVRAVIRSLRDNTDSPRVCDELTRMLGEEE